jgi:hypothetical protein
MSFADARQFLACGQTVSQHPTWLHQEEIDLAPLKEQCRRELQAAADKEGTYPLAPSDLDGSLGSIVETLDQHRPYWTPSCEALYDSTIAADIARYQKETLLRDAHRRLVDAWLAGELLLYGLDVWSGAGGFELIRPAVADWYSDDELGEIEIRGDAMFKHPAGAPGYSKRPMYEKIRIERRALLDWVGRSDAHTNTDPEEVPPSGAGMVPASPEEGPPQQTNADTEQAPANAQAPVDADITGRGSSETRPNAEAPIEAETAGRGSTETPESTRVTGRTGLPGRPPAKYFIDAEVRRRLERGDFPEKPAPFRKEIFEWYSTTSEVKEGILPGIKPRSLENLIRPLWRSRDSSKARKTSP